MMQKKKPVLRETINMIFFSSRWVLMFPWTAQNFYWHSNIQQAESSILTEILQLNLHHYNKPPPRHFPMSRLKIKMDGSTLSVQRGSTALYQHQLHLPRAHLYLGWVSASRSELALRACKTVVCNQLAWLLGKSEGSPLEPKWQKRYFCPVWAGP